MKKPETIIALILLSVIFCVVAWREVFSPILECSQERITQADSPDGKHQALITIINCGATTDYETEIVIDPGDSAILRVKGYHGKDEIQIQWVNSRELKINYQGDSSLIRSIATNTDDVIIQYYTNQVPLLVECLYPNCQSTKEEERRIQQHVNTELEAAIRTCEKENKNCDGLRALRKEFYKNQ